MSCSRGLKLQWGRGFSAAEILHRIILRRCYIIASMGPRLFSRGNPATKLRIPTQKLASMGPRLFSRGNLQRKRMHQWLKDASMGPRLFSRGNPEKHKALCAFRAELQWGRGFSAAEIRRSIRRCVRFGPSFNGAAAFQPRKSIASILNTPLFGGLQWGRGFSAAEMCYRHTGMHSPRLASMGPRLFSRGNGIS